MKSDPSAQRINPITARQSGGFTLIELMVTVTLVAIIAGMVVLSIGDDPKRAASDESQRLQALLSQLREEAVLQGKVYFFRAELDKYAFLFPDKKGKLAPIEDELFRPRQFSEGVAVIDSEVDGKATHQDPVIIIYPTGDLSPFRMIIGNSGAHWQLSSDINGEIQREPAEIKDN